MREYINTQTGEIIHTDGFRLHAYKVLKNGDHTTRFRDVISLKRYRRKQRKAELKEIRKEWREWRKHKNPHCNYPDFVG